jgi:hypothetical protein
VCVERDCVIAWDLSRSRLTHVRTYERGREEGGGRTYNLDLDLDQDLDLDLVASPSSLLPPALCLMVLP